MSLDVDSAVLSSVAYAIGDDTQTESVPSAPHSSNDTSVTPPATSATSAEPQNNSKAAAENRFKGGRGHGRFGNKGRRGPPKFAGSHGFQHDDQAGNNPASERPQQPHTTKSLQNGVRDVNPSDDRNGKSTKARSRGSRGRGRGRGPPGGPPAKTADNI